jgi:hypothetical protein
VGDFLEGENLFQADGAKAQLTFCGLDAALKRRSSTVLRQSSTVVHAAIFHGRARVLEMHMGAEFAAYAPWKSGPSRAASERSWYLGF